MTQFEDMAVRIIRAQELIMGPIAWTEAAHAPGLAIGGDHNVAITGEPKEALDGLVGQYERLFGRAARETSREAVASILADLSSVDVPASLVAA